MNVLESWIFAETLCRSVPNTLPLSLKMFHLKHPRNITHEQAGQDERPTRPGPPWRSLIAGMVMPGNKDPHRYKNWLQER